MGAENESPTLAEAITDVVMLNDEANQITLSIIGVNAAFQSNRENLAGSRMLAAFALADAYGSTMFGNEGIFQVASRLVTEIRGRKDKLLGVISEKLSAALISISTSETAAVEAIRRKKSSNQQPQGADNNPDIRVSGYEIVE